MTFNAEEKQIIVDSMKLHLQVIKQRYSEDRIRQMTTKMAGVARKLDEIDISESEKLPGITDEQFENVCKICDKFKGHCIDAVAKKFPGKCDPILHYNRGVENGKEKEQN